jgi:hypothetical protein
MVPAREYPENYGTIKRKPKKEVSKWRSSVGAVDAKERKNAHEEIGEKECPLESVPSKAGLSAPTLLGEKAPLHAVVVVVSISWHTGLTAAKSLAPSATFGTYGKGFATILEAVVKDRI